MLHFTAREQKSAQSNLEYFDRLYFKFQLCFYSNSAKFDIIWYLVRDFLLVLQYYVSAW